MRLLISLGLLSLVLCSIRAEDNWECPERNGYFRNPKDPHKFYECVAGHAYTFICAEGLVFNESIKACDYNVGPIVVRTSTTAFTNTGTRQRHDSTSPTTGTSANSNSTITSNTNTTVSSKINSTVNPVTETGRQRHTIPPSSY